LLEIALMQAEEIMALTVPKLMRLLEY